MKRVLRLGIEDPHRRVVVWLCGCGALSVGAFVAGAAGFVVVMVVLVGLLGRAVR